MCGSLLIMLLSYWNIGYCERHTGVDTLSNYTVDSMSSLSVNLGIPSDSVYLIIVGDLYDPELIWKHAEIFIKANARFNKHIYMENGCVKWDMKNGAEIRISENIYEYISSIWERTNQRVKAGRCEIKAVNGKYLIFPKP